MKLILFSFLLTVTLINMSISVKQPKHHLKNEKVNKTKVRAKQVMIIPADEDNYPEHWDLHNSRFRRSAIRASSEHVPQDLDGDVIFTARKLFVVDFTLGTRQLNDVNVTKAFFQLYHRQQLKQPADGTGNSTMSSDPPISSVRISVGLHQSPDNREGWPRLWTSSKLLDSRVVNLLAPGWAKFDISRAVLQWLPAISYKNDADVTGMTSPPRRRCLDVWAESHGVDTRRLQLVQHVRLVTPASRNRGRRPRMVVFFPSSEEQ